MGTLVQALLSAPRIKYQLGTQHPGEEFSAVFVFSQCMTQCWRSFVALYIHVIRHHSGGRSAPARSVLCAVSRVLDGCSTAVTRVQLDRFLQATCNGTAVFLLDKGQVGRTGACERIVLGLGSGVELSGAAGFLWIHCQMSGCMWEACAHIWLGKNRWA